MNTIRSMKKKMIHSMLSDAMRKVLYTIIFLVVCYLVGALVCGTRTWMGSEPLYRMLKTIQNWYVAIIVVVALVVIVVLLIHGVKKNFDYLFELVQASEELYQDTDEIITLSPELKEIEAQMNHVKLDVRRNRTAAREAEQRKNDLVVYLAHDLKTPLTSVIGYLTLLEEERQISPELQEKYLGIARDKAERLEDLINEFFEITRFNLTTLSLEKSKINLGRMIEQIVYEFAPMFREKEITCTQNVPTDLMCYMDAEKMERVFDNLLRNAVNYSYEGSTINLSVEDKEGSIYIVVQNEGNTIPEEKLSRIFEQFFRLDSSRASRNGGAGLGLAIAKEIVELHGGTIEAKSEDEKIWFMVELPKN